LRTEISLREAGSDYSNAVRDLKLKPVMEFTYSDELFFSMSKT
jgi:hypothetical protein